MKALIYRGVGQIAVEDRPKPELRAVGDAIVKVRKTTVCATDIVAPGGVIANIGVHGTKVDLHLERLWSHNIAITTRLVDTVTAPLLIRSVEARKVDPTQLISHHFPFDRIIDAYETFGHAAETHALKVTIELG